MANGPKAMKAATYSFHLFRDKEKPAAKPRIILRRKYTRNIRTKDSMDSRVPNEKYIIGSDSAIVRIIEFHCSDTTADKRKTAAQGLT